MKRLYAVLALAIPMMIAAPASARNYDCTKAGNANKAVCKGATPTTPAAKPASVTKSVPAAKPAPAPKPAVAAATKPARNYDCSKAGNANKAVCKGAVSTSPAPKPAPTARAAPAPRAAPPPRAAPANTASAAGPSGATAKCRDGSYSHSVHHSGSCSRHGGVAQFY